MVFFTGMGFVAVEMHPIGKIQSRNKWTTKITYYTKKLIDTRRSLQYGVQIEEVWCVGSTNSQLPLQFLIRSYKTRGWKYKTSWG